MCYYFLLFFFNCLYSSYTFDDFKNNQDHLKRSQIMLDTDFSHLKKPYASKIFKDAFGFPNRISVVQLNPASKKAIELAYQWKACCNPKVNPFFYSDKTVYRLVDYLVLCHRLPKNSKICGDKLTFLIKKKYVAIDDESNDQGTLIGYVFTVPTFNLLLSLGFDIDAVDKKGKNFPIKIHEYVEPYRGNESEDELQSKRAYYNHIQYMIDYFGTKNGWLFRRDCFGNTVLNYIFWNGFQFLTESRINDLIKRFKSSGEDIQVLLLALVDHSSYYLNDFKQEYLFLSAHQEKLKALKQENKYLMSLIDTNRGISEEVIKDGIAKSIRIFDNQTAIELAERRDKLHILEQYIAYLQMIFRSLLRNGIDVINEPVCPGALEYVLNKNNSAIDENFFYEVKTFDALLYHWMFFIAPKYRAIIENNFIFSWIICRKLLKYKKSNEYKKRIKI